MSVAIYIFPESQKYIDILVFILFLLCHSHILFSDITNFINIFFNLYKILIIKSISLHKHYFKTNDSQSNLNLRQFVLNRLRNQRWQKFSSHEYIHMYIHTYNAAAATDVQYIHMK